MSRCLPVLALLAFSASARAAEPVPVMFTVQGRLLDGNDAPVTGVHDVTVTLWKKSVDAAGESNQLWKQKYAQVNFSAGVFALVVGDPDKGTALTYDTLGAQERWLSFAIDAGGDLLPRQRLTAVPLAFVAEHANKADLAAEADHAKAADLATKATEADHAKNADLAATATEATHAATATNATQLGGEAPAAFHDATKLVGAVPAASLPNSVLDVTGAGALAATRTGGTVALSLAKASATADGYLAASDFTAFSAKLDAVKTGPTLTGNGKGTGLDVVFGNTATTAARGDDVRLSDARDPKPGSSNYLQNGTTAQSASFNVTGTGVIGGTLNVGGKLTVAGGLDLSNANNVFTVPMPTTLPTCDQSRQGSIVFQPSSHLFYGCDGSTWRSFAGNRIDITNQAVSFSVDSNTGGAANFVADHVDLRTTTNWPNYCVQTSGSGAHWIVVQFSAPRVITAFGISGYPGGSHKPAATYTVEGSTNGSTWTTLWTGDGTNWTADANGSYPPRNTTELSTTGAFAYYRVYATSWTNGYMLMCDLALYE